MSRRLTAAPSPGLGQASAAHAEDPQTVWAALAPLLAARGRVRVSRDGGRSYRARDERPVTSTLPNQPAALLTYDHTGCAPALCLDLDSSRGGRAAVERDLHALTGLLRRIGARWFSDTSPNGGRHLYVPLAEPAPFTEARAVVLALAARTPTLDPQPMLSIHSGCLRPPGARHRTGGHQRLDQRLAAAVDVLHRPTPRAVWERLLIEVGADDPPHDATQDATREAVQDAAPDSVHEAQQPTESLEPLHGYGAPDESFMRIARTGEFPPDRYRTPSEARQAVIWAAVAAGWRFTDVARRLHDGTWPGLASFYARYRARHQHTALARDWHNALRFEKQRRARRTESSSHARLRTTSTHQSHARTVQEGGSKVTADAVHREVRVWLAAVDLLHANGDPKEKAVLYALAQAAVLTGSLVVEHGNRSLAIATGFDQSTVGRILRRLRQAPADRLLLDVVREAEGVRAHCYSLVVPPLLLPACQKKPWRRGRIHAVRPVFRELGMVPAFIYAALEQVDGPRSGRDLAAIAGVSPAATYEALHVLSSWGLADKASRGGWQIGPASPERLAERFGVEEEVAAQVERYRAERIAWWRYLGLYDKVLLLEDARSEPRHRRPEPDAPPDEISTAPPEPGDPSADPSGDWADDDRPGSLTVLSQTDRWDEMAQDITALLEQELGARLVE